MQSRHRVRLHSALTALLLLILLAAECQAAENKLPSEPYQWRNVKIVAGGFITGILFHPTRPNLLYVRTDIGGAYRWDPSTRKFIPLTDWLGQFQSNLLGIESFAVDPTDPHRLYLAAGTYTQAWAGNGAILCSQDQGRTFQTTPMPLKMGSNNDGRSMGERLAVDPNLPAKLYFGSRNDGLWESLDHGAHWNRATFPELQGISNIGIQVVLFDPHSGKPGSPTPVIYAAVGRQESPLLISHDAGKTWSPQANQPTGYLAHHLKLDKRGVLTITYSNTPGPNGVTNGAVWQFNTKSQEWKDITPVKPGSGNVGVFGYAGLALDSKHPGAIMVSSLDKWVSKDDIWRTQDDGAHWQPIRPLAKRDSSLSPYLNWGEKEPELGHWIGALEIDPTNSDHALYGTGATLWGTQNLTAMDHNKNTNWFVHADGIEETAVLALVSPPSGPYLISGLGDIGGFRHDDLDTSPSGGIWTNPIINSVIGLDFAELHPECVVRVGGGTPQKRGAISRDGAVTWTPFADPEGIFTESSGVAISADGKVIIWSQRRAGALRSIDDGKHWSPCKGVLPGSNVISDRQNPGRFYTLDGSRGILLISNDAGASFTESAAGLPIGYGKLTASFAGEGDLWAALQDHGLWHAPKADATFLQISSVEIAYAVGFGKARQAGGRPAVYLSGKVGGVTGVFRSEDDGASWVRINDDLHQYGWIGQAVTGDPRIFGRVYLATNGRGILYADPVKTSK